MGRSSHGWINSSKQLVFESNGEVVTDSLTIAGMFGKEHKNVKRDILETISKLASLRIVLKWTN